MEGTLIVKWDAKATIAATAPSADPPTGDPFWAILVHDIIHRSYKTANGGTAVGSTSLTTAPLYSIWMQKAGSAYEKVQQSGTFTITAAAKARQLDESDENGSLRQLAAAVHTLTWKDAMMKTADIIAQKKLYEAKVGTLFSAGTKAATKAAIAAACAATQCASSVLNHAAGGAKDKDGAPIYVDTDQADIAVTKVDNAVAGWVLGVESEKVSAKVTMTMNIDTTITQDALKTDVEFIKGMKAGILEALKAKEAKITDLKGFKIDKVVIAARRLDEQAEVRELATADKKVTVDWSCEPPKAGGLKALS